MDADPVVTARLSLEPIGVVRTAFTTKVDAARQPQAAAGSRAVIELFPGRNFEHALEDLDGWEMIWVIFWFHRNGCWRPKVLPPRSTTGRKGVFATRSPHRPNPIGISAVRLERVEGLKVFIRDVDLLDGTPVLDIKPYVPYSDAHPAVGSGWLDAAASSEPGRAKHDPVPAWRVVFEPPAAEQAAWIEERTGLALRERVIATLQLGPQPHPYRRIRRVGEAFRLAVKEWRVSFGVDGRAITVWGVTSGFTAAHRQSAGAAQADAVAVHRAFTARWPGPSTEA
jgi:tRNA-Thr(GGU) m(6)t(6)A37 methyltransferase TsaA